MDLSSILANISAFAGPTAVSGGANERTVAGAHVAEGAEGDGVAAVVFSKDRPYQLDQLLRSIEAFASDVNSVYVLYKCSDQWQSQYEEVLAAHATAIGVPESCFEADLRRVFFDKLEQHGRCVSAVLFLVDDAIFTSAVTVGNFARALHATPNALGAQLKLHPGILYSHPSMSVCTRPQMIVHPVPNDPDVYLSFDLGAGSHDWCYPFDLCGGLYRTRFVKRLLDAMRGQLHNPNILEVAGNQFWRNSQGAMTHSLCCAKQALVVITTNKVQETYDVPIYSTAAGDLAVLNARQDPLALSAYANEPYFLSHVGDLFFGPPSTIPLPQITVVIPVHNAQRYLQQCLSSLEQQRGVIFEVIIVDDGSTDGSMALLQGFEVDHTNANCAQVKIVRQAHSGLVAALNAGIACAQNNVIARLDADDVCLPNRLSRQLEFLTANPQIAILGSQAARFSDPPTTETVLTAPTHPVLAQWRLFLESPVLHPTVCFRRDVLQAIRGQGDLYQHQISVSSVLIGDAHALLEVGGFDVQDANGRSGNDVAAPNCVEDLELWCAAGAGRSFCVASVSDVLLRYRVHSQQKSRLEHDRAAAQASVILWQFINHVAGGAIPAGTSPRHLHVLRRPSQAQSGAELEAAYHLLSGLRRHLGALVISAHEDGSLTNEEVSKYAMEVVDQSVASIARDLLAVAMRICPKPEAEQLAQLMGVTNADLLQSALLATLAL